MDDIGSQETRRSVARSVRDFNCLPLGRANDGKMLANLRQDAGFAQYPAMPDRTEILDRILALLDRAVSYRGEVYRLAEVLEDPARIILAPVGPTRIIMADSYGHPAGRGHEFIELRVFDDIGNLSEEIRLVSLAEGFE